MINFLRIKNYQSHRDTRLDFVSGVNVLVGLSQSGKTAASQRAVKLLRANRPLGAGKFFPRNLDKGETEVVMGLSEGREVGIKKRISRDAQGKALVRSSTYVLDGKEYEGFKDRVPDEVERALNFSELNFQEQFGGAFLILSPPSEVAKVFNRVVHLDEIDGYTSDITKEVNRGNAEIRILKEQLKTKKEESSQYDDLPDMEDMVEKAEGLQGRVKAIENEWHSVAGILDEYDEISEEQEKWNEVLEIEDLVNEATRMQGRIEKKKGDIEELDSLVGQIEKCDKSVGEHAKVLSMEELVNEAIGVQGQVESKEEDIGKLNALILQIESCDGDIEEYSKVLSVEELVNKAQTLGVEFDRVSSEFDRVGRIVDDLEDTNWKLEKAERGKKGLVDGYTKMLTDLQRCPTCFSFIGEEDVKRIVKAL